jgi:hypothetical protein
LAPVPHHDWFSGIPSRRQRKIRRADFLAFGSTLNEVFSRVTETRRKEILLAGFEEAERDRPMLRWLNPVGK